MTWLSLHAIGGVVSDGGTTQLTGVSGVLNFDIDTSAVIESIISEVGGSLAAQTDADADAGTGVDFAATSGKSVVFSVVLSHGVANDTPAIEARPGAVADTGEEVELSDAALTAVLTHAYWAPLALVTVERTGDTAVTFSVDNAWRNRSVKGFAGDDLASLESEFKTAAGVP
tara:strand:+ start:2123 stop:2638 length:516 start_codon:yes stop_codon:yes gene_type:complete